MSLEAAKDYRKIVIIGAGAVGSTFAYALQISGDADEIVLVDLDKKRAEGEAMDLNHGLFFTPPALIRSGEYSDCGDANIVVVTAGAKQKPGQSRMELVGQNVKISKDIMDSILEYTKDAIILMVTNPVDVLTYAALKHSGLPRNQVIGSGTVLDSARFRYMLSDHCEIDARNVHSYVLGEHGDSEVPIWSMTHLAGIPIDQFCKNCPKKCSPDMKESIVERIKDSAYHIIEAKGFTNYAVGLALVKICSSILRGENSILTVSVLMDGEFGISDVCLSAPCIINSRGAGRILTTDIEEKESQALNDSADSIKKVLKEAGLQ